MLGDPLANGRTSHLLPTLPFIRPFLLSLFLPPPLRLFLTSFPRSAVPWFSQTHNIGVPPIHLFLSFSPFFLLFSLPFFSLFFFFLSSSRKRTLPSVAVPSRFSFNHSSPFTTLLVIAENGGGCARNRPIERERERKSIRTENFRITERINLSDLFRFFFDFVPRPFKRRRFYFFSPSITRWKFVFGSETLIIGFQTAMSSQCYVRVFLSARYLYTACMVLLHH